MEEVRSYWQVASIQHFCALFQKPFKLPSFEPEELEQAFIIDIPEPPKSNSTSCNSNIHNQNHNIDASTNGNDDQDDGDIDQSNGVDAKADPDYEGKQSPQPGISSTRSSSPDYNPSYDSELLFPPSTHFRKQQLESEPEPQPLEEQELHLLVKLAIALIKPHFNTKISFTNYENYLRKLIDKNWVELEHCPSPLSIPFISPDGIELTKNLNLRELPLSDKIDIFTALCDYRLWCEDASEYMKDYPLDELRLESIGKDSRGYEYWYFSGTRIFRENIDLSQDLICRKKRIKELEYKLIEHERARILKEQEDKRRAEIERAKQIANEAREARIAAKRQQEEAAAANSAKKKKTSNTPVSLSRMGLRERRSSATGNNSESQSQSTPTRTLRSRTKPQEQVEVTTPRSSQKTTRGSAKNSRQNEKQERSKQSSPEEPRKAPEQECREELERITITQEERSEAWCVVCESLEEWENFTKKYEKTKSINEKYLSSHINNVLLPHIQAIYAKKAAEIRRKEKELLFSLATRRLSTRISTKRAQEEEEERLAQIREVEIQKKKAEAEVRLRAELEREMKAKKNDLVVNGGSSSTCSQDGGDVAGRHNTRQRHQVAQEDTYDTIEFNGIVHPDRLAEFYEALELIVDTVRTSKHAWPFVDPVPETEPGYYDLIKKPMDLKTLRTKVEFRHYKNLLEIEKDFQLLVNNCERFNGPKAVYTKMVYKLWKSFRKNVQLYLQRDLHMDEQETFVYPSVVPVAPPLQPPPPPQPEVEPEELVQAPITQNGIVKEEAAEHDTHGPDAHDHTNNNQDEKISNGLESETSEANVGKEIRLDNNVNDELYFETKIEPKIETDSRDACFNMPITKPSQNSHISIDSELKKPTTLQYEPTPLEMPIEFMDGEFENPPEPIVEEVIIDSYTETCPDDSIYPWQQS